MSDRIRRINAVSVSYAPLLDLSVFAAAGPYLRCPESGGPISLEFAIALLDLEYLRYKTFCRVFLALGQDTFESVGVGTGVGVSCHDLDLIGTADS